MAFSDGVSLTWLSVISLNIISLHGFVQRSLLQIGNSLQIPINVLEFISNQESELNLIPTEFNSICTQFKVHAMSFDISIQMELNFHKINSIISPID
jgi:hypothetical protein